MNTWQTRFFAGTSPSASVQHVNRLPFVSYSAIDVNTTGLESEVSERADKSKIRMNPSEDIVQIIVV